MVERSKTPAAHGGPRTGAGRPRTAQPLVAVQIRLTVGEVEALDAARGDVPRAAWCRDAVMIAAAQAARGRTDR